MEWYRIKKAPLVLGHEITGVIEAVGEGVVLYKKGDRVFVSHHVPCNTCRYCLSGQQTVCDTLQTTNYDPGGFAEYIRVPSLNVDWGLFILPHEVSFEAGVFIEPLACVVRAQRTADIKTGQSVLVLGSGISGLLQIALAKASGAGRIAATDVNEYRLAAAKKFGADEAINARADFSRQKFDLVIICTGALPAFEQALNSVDKAGTILFFAPTVPGVKLSIPVNDFWRQSIKLMTSYGNSPYDAEVAIELIRTKRIPVEEMITHRLGLSEAAKGFKLVADGKDSIKVLLKP